MLPESINIAEEKSFETQVKAGERFKFGKNWKSFLDSLTEERIQVAESSLKDMMGIENLAGKSFLDIGCGSGLFSLAAKNLNAKVHSIDFDKESVNCAKFLKEKYYPGEEDWTIEEGSVLDTDHISSLNKFDVVYSWGVLHHTGNMLLALENATLPVKNNGSLFIAIYNDQGTKSAFWLRVKEMYNSNIFGKLITVVIFFPYNVLRGLLSDITAFNNPFRRYADHKKNRGMSKLHDWHDWLGGLPYEVASPEFILDYYKKRGFHLEKIKTTNSLGCNQFVFSKTRPVSE